MVAENGDCRKGPVGGDEALISSDEGCTCADIMYIVFDVASESETKILLS